MHPTCAERARSLHRLIAASALLLAVIASGCSDRSGSGSRDAAASAEADANRFAPVKSIGEPEAAERDSALSVLNSMERTVFDSAFVDLADRSFTRQTRIEQIDPASGTIRSRRERTIQYDAGAASGTVVATADSGAAFGDNPMDVFGPDTEPEQRPGDLAVSAFPDDPAYLSERTQEAFRYRIRPFTYEGRRAWIVSIQARPDGQGADQSVRHAKLTVLRDSRELVAATALRSANVLLFREDSRMSIQLKPDAGAGWLPAETRFHARIDIPFRDPVEFRAVSSYQYSVL